MKNAKMHVVFMLSIIAGQLCCSEDVVITRQEQVSDFAKYVLTNKKLLDSMAHVIRPQHFLKDVSVAQPRNNIEVDFIANTLKDITYLEKSLMKIEHGVALSDYDMPEITVTDASDRAYLSDLKLIPIIYSKAQHFYLMAQYMIGVKKHKDHNAVQALLLPHYPDQGRSDSFIDDVHACMIIFFNWQETFDNMIGQMVEKMASTKEHIFKSSDLEKDLFELFKSIEDSQYSIRKMYKQFQNDGQKAIFQQYLKGAIQTLGFFALDYQKQLHVAQQKDAAKMYRFMMSDAGNELYNYVLYKLSAVNNDMGQLNDYMGAYCIALYDHFNSDISKRTSQEGAFGLDVQSCLHLMLVQLQMHKFGIAAQHTSYLRAPDFIRCNAYIADIKELLDTPSKYNAFVKSCADAQHTVNKIMGTIDDKLAAVKLNLVGVTSKFMETLHQHFPDVTTVKSLQEKLGTHHYMAPVALQSVVYGASFKVGIAVPAAQVTAQTIQDSAAAVDDALAGLSQADLAQIEEEVRQGDITPEQAVQEAKQKLATSDMSEEKSQELLQEFEDDLEKMFEERGQMFANAQNTMRQQYDRSFIESVRKLAIRVVGTGTLQQDTIEQIINNNIDVFDQPRLTEEQKSFVDGYLKGLQA